MPPAQFSTVSVGLSRRCRPLLHFLVVHRGGLVAALPKDLNWLPKRVLGTFAGNVTGRLAQPNAEVRIMNRIVRRKAQRYECEADRRHSELLIVPARASPARRLGRAGRPKPAFRMLAVSVPVPTACGFVAARFANIGAQSVVVAGQGKKNHTSTVAKAWTEEDRTGRAKIFFVYSRWLVSICRKRAPMSMR